MQRDRALAPLRLAAGRSVTGAGRCAAAAPANRGAGGTGGSKDPARGRPSPRPLGPPDDRRGAAREHRPVPGGFLAGSAPEPDRLEVVAAVAARSALEPDAASAAVAGAGGGPVQEGDRDQEADQREGRQPRLVRLRMTPRVGPATGRLSHRPATQIAGRRVSGPLAGWEWGRKTPLECRFRRIGGRGSNSVRRIRSNPRGHDVLQSGTEWVSVASQSWSKGRGDEAPPTSPPRPAPNQRVQLDLRRGSPLCRSLVSTSTISTRRTASRSRRGSARRLPMESFSPKGSSPPSGCSRPRATSASRSSSSARPTRSAGAAG